MINHHSRSFRSQPPTQHRQAGATLAVVLMFLLLLTIFGVTAVTTSTLQERMAGNMKDQYIAFEASETALRGAESWLRNLTEAASQPTDVQGGIWQAASLGDFLDGLHDNSWWLANGVEYGVSGTQEVTQSVADPYFIVSDKQFVRDNIEEGSGGTYTAPPGRVYFRATARGVGGTANAEAVVQSTYVRRFR